MKFVRSLALPVVCLVGCSAEQGAPSKYPAVTGSSIVRDTSFARPESVAKVEALAENLRRAFEARDWEAVASHFWGVAEMTPEEAEQAFGAAVDRCSPVTQVGAWYIEFEGADYTTYEDKGAIPIPEPQMRGRTDLGFGPKDDPNYRGFDFVAYLAEVDGRFVIGSWEWL